MTARERSLFWAGFLLLFFVGIFFLRDVLLPFVVGMAVAYLLDPVVDRVERLKVGRGGATLIVLLVFFAIVVGAALLLLPLLRSQITLFLEVFPGYVQRLDDLLRPILLEFADDVDTASALKKLPSIAGDALGWFANFLGRLVKGGAAIANFISVIAITPIVSFYLLRDWDHIVEAIDGWLPRAQADEIRGQLREIDRTLSSFVRGQGMVCLILGVFYAVGLSFAGLNFGLAIGLFAGLISFVPFVGTIAGGVLSVGLALAQFSSWEPILIVAAIFIVGQVIEGNFLTPNLVGDAVGLHPVWVIFALLAGASLFGFLGVLLAVPIMAIVGVLARYGLQRYLASPLHLHGIEPPDPEK